VITNEDYMLCSLKYCNQRFWLCGLGRFVNQDLSKLKISESAIKSRHTRCANNIGVTEDLILCLPLKLFKSSFIFLVKLALLLHKFHQLLHLLKLSFFQVFYLLVQRKVVNV